MFNEIQIKNAIRVWIDLLENRNAEKICEIYFSTLQGMNEESVFDRSEIMNMANEVLAEITHDGSGI
jgi:hypothetical protein